MLQMRQVHHVRQQHLFLWGLLVVKTGDEEFIDLGGGVSMTMALIPAGDDPKGRYTLTNDFYMMTTEVTQAMFLRFMTYSPHIGCLFCPGSDNPLYGKIGDNKPIYQIYRSRAQDFANKMTLHYNIQYERIFSIATTVQILGQSIRAVLQQ